MTSYTFSSRVRWYDDDGRTFGWFILHECDLCHWCATSHEEMLAHVEAECDVETTYATVRWARATVPAEWRSTTP